MKKLSLGISIVIILSMLLSLLTPVLADDADIAVEEPEATVEEAVEAEEPVEPVEPAELVEEPAEAVEEPVEAVEEPAEAVEESADEPEEVAEPEAVAEAEVSNVQGFIVINATDFDSGVYQENDSSAGSHDIRPDEEVQTEVGESTFGGNIGWTDSGEWVQYTVNVEKAGSYSAYVQAAAGGDGGSIEVYYNDELIGTADVSATGGWQAYQIFDAGTVDMAAGENVIKVVFPNGGVNFSAMFFIEAADTTPYVDRFIAGGTNTIKAVEFDSDGFYEDTVDRATANNWSWYFDSWTAGELYIARPEFEADHSGPQQEAATVPGLGDIGALCYIGGELIEDDEVTAEAEYVSYTIDVLKAGNYALSVWAVSGSSDKYMDFYLDGELVSASPVIPNTGWGSAYNLYDVAVLDLTLGTHVMKVVWPGGDVNVAAYVLNEGDVYAVAPPAPVVEVAEVAEPAVVAVVAEVEEVTEIAAVAEVEVADVAAVQADAAKPNPKSGDSLLFPVILVVLVGAAFVTAKKVKAI